MMKIFSVSVAVLSLTADVSSAFVPSTTTTGSTTTSSSLNEAKYNYALGKYETFNGEYNTISGYYDPCFYREMPGEIPSDGQGFTDFYYQPYKPSSSNNKDGQMYNGNLNSGNEPKYYQKNPSSTNMNNYPNKQYTNNHHRRPKEPQRVTGITNYVDDVTKRTYDPSFAYTLPLKHPSDPNYPHLN